MVLKICLGSRIASDLGMLVGFGVIGLGAGLGSPRSSTPRWGF